ncbi:Uncharacterised protein [Vibrio cholerae]|nr:Uncharacterised protein [Vibrio cholerae]
MADNRRWNQRLITLHIHHNVIGGNRHFRHHFRQTFCTRLMIRRSHTHHTTESLNRLFNTLIVGCNDHAVGSRLHGLLIYPLNHWLTANIGERLTR